MYEGLNILTLVCIATCTAGFIPFWFLCSPSIDVLLIVCSFAMVFFCFGSLSILCVSRDRLSMKWLLSSIIGSELAHCLMTGRVTWLVLCAALPLKIHNISGERAVLKIYPLLIGVVITLSLCTLVVPMYRKPIEMTNWLCFSEFMFGIVVPVAAWALQLRKVARHREETAVLAVRVPRVSVASSSDSGGSGERREITAAPAPRQQPRGKRPQIPYTISHVIGQGAFAEVCLGVNLLTGEHVALKRLKSGHPREFTKNLIHELCVMKNLIHPRIVSYLGCEYDEKDRICLCLEFVNGGSIARLLGKFGPFSEQIIRYYVIQILEGVRFLHSRGVVHRDIKGANILVNINGEVKIADFGCSVLLSAKYEGQKGKIGLGTVLFMAPEVCHHHEATLKSDIWSIGCTILQMATGAMPWSERKFASTSEAMILIGSGEETPMLPRHFSEEGKDFLNQCFKKNPKDRADVTGLMSHQWLLREAKDVVTDPNQIWTEVERTVGTATPFAEGVVLMNERSATQLEQHLTFLHSQSIISSLPNSVPTNSVPTNERHLSLPENRPTRKNSDDTRTVDETEVIYVDTSFSSCNSLQQQSCYNLFDHNRVSDNTLHVHRRPYPLAPPRDVMMARADQATSSSSSSIPPGRGMDDVRSGQEGLGDYTIPARPEPGVIFSTGTRDRTPRVVVTVTAN